MTQPFKAGDPMSPTATLKNHGCVWAHVYWVQSCTATTRVHRWRIVVWPLDIEVSCEISGFTWWINIRRPSAARLRRVQCEFRWRYTWIQKPHIPYDNLGECGPPVNKPLLLLPCKVRSSADSCSVLMLTGLYVTVSVPISNGMYEGESGIETHKLFLT